MAVVPLLIGGTDLMVFSVLLLVFALATALVVKNPFMLPEGAFRIYVQHLDRKGVIPFGVPISVASICTLTFEVLNNVLAVGAMPV
jgi:prepilin peptidase CpaA